MMTRSGHWEWKKIIPTEQGYFEVVGKDKEVNRLPSCVWERISVGATLKQASIKPTQI